MSFVLSDVPMFFLDTNELVLSIDEIIVGTRLLAYQNHEVGKDVVSWVGDYHVNIDKTLPNILAGYPVRILKNAIAEQVPYADLLVTSNHEIVIDDLFIPIRRLVNGASIYFDTNYTRYVTRSFALRKMSAIFVNGLKVRSR